MPPTPESAVPKPSLSAGNSLGQCLPSSASIPSSAYTQSSSPASEIETPQAERNISNRFWEKNAKNSRENVPGIGLASDSSDPDDDSEATRTKKLRSLDTKIKRLLVIETGPVRMRALETNGTVQEYEGLLQAFAHKPKTKKKRTLNINRLMTFLQDHPQIVGLYNQFAHLDQKVRKDRVLPEFEVTVEEEDDQAAGGEIGAHGHKHEGRAQDDRNDQSDEEGIVTQTFKGDEDFDGPSMFNTKGLSVPSIFNRKPEPTEKEEREFVLHKREGTLDKNMSVGIGKRRRMQDTDGTPTRPSKMKRNN